MSGFAYQYVVIRLVPRVERQEFVNVGVVLYAQEAEFIDGAFHLDAERVRAVDPHVDLGSVSYLDSAGLSMLVDLARRMRTGRSRLSCRVPLGTPARRIIALTGLEATLHVEPAEPADVRERPDG